jgi:very-short-patch-repair endonuclease
MTRAEKKIWFEFLRFFKPQVHRQRPMGKFIPDFYIPKGRLIVEIDGNSHFNEKAATKDKERTAFFESFNITVIRFTNDEVFEQFEQVCQIIKNKVFERQTPPSLDDSGRPL